MKKFNVLVVSTIILCLITAFTLKPEPNNSVLVLRTELTPELLAPKVEVVSIEIKGHDAFLHKLGNFESGNDYKKVNRYGYMGRYQFGNQALEQVDIDVPKKVFLNSPALQEEAMLRLMKYNDNTLDKLITKYDGKTLHGVEVTRSGVIAAAHLGGATNVKKWFRTGKVFADANGTSIVKYMKIFSGYSLSID